MGRLADDLRTYYTVISAVEREQYRQRFLFSA